MEIKLKKRKEKRKKEKSYPLTLNYQEFFHKYTDEKYAGKTKV